MTWYMLLLLLLNLSFRQNSDDTDPQLPFLSIKHCGVCFLFLQARINLQHVKVAESLAAQIWPSMFRCPEYKLGYRYVFAAVTVPSNPETPSAKFNQ